MNALSKHTIRETIHFEQSKQKKNRLNNMLEREENDRTFS